MDDQKETAIKVIRKWQREHRQLEGKIDALIFTIDSRREAADRQRHQLALALLQELFELHCETELELLRMLTQLHGSESIELLACKRQTSKDQQYIRSRLSEIAFAWDSNGGLRIAQGNYLFYVFAEMWEQNAERMELAIRSFFPIYPERSWVGKFA